MHVVDASSCFFMEEARAMPGGNVFCFLFVFVFLIVTMQCLVQQS